MASTEKQVNELGFEKISPEDRIPAAAGILFAQEMRLSKYRRCLEKLLRIIELYDIDNSDPELGIVMPADQRRAVGEARELLGIKD